jgi:hypothetical protein
MFRHRHILQTVTAEIQTAHVAYIQRKSNYPDFMRIQMLAVPN